MRSSRLAAVALLGLGVALTVACGTKNQNGQECLKDTDCESDRCVAAVCVDPHASQGAFDGGTIADTGSTEAEADADAATEAAAETSTESGTDETGTTPDAGDAD